MHTTVPLFHIAYKQAFNLYSNVCSLLDDVSSFIDLVLVCAMQLMMSSLMILAFQTDASGQKPFLYGHQLGMLIML